MIGARDRLLWLAQTLGDDECRLMVHIGGVLHKDMTLHPGVHAMSSDPSYWSERTVDELAACVVAIFAETLRRREAKA